jgi:hypothetical protein
LRLYYGDLQERGTVDLIEAEWDSARKTDTPRHRLEFMANGLPWLQEQFPSFATFSQATVTEVVGNAVTRIATVEARTLASGTFINCGTNFAFTPFPDEAQLAPAHAVIVADLDGDGAQDVFLSQNFFALPWEMHRLDAGRGLLLRGDGMGGLAAIGGHESGIRMYGEQRGAAVSDYDGDGRVDLVVAQNAATTRLFHNTTGRPGLRVRLVGSPANFQGVGAVVRAQWGGKLGPALPVLAGSGYWSHSSVTQILTGPERPDAVRVRWPGGREHGYAISSSATEIVLGILGTVVAEGR